MAEGETKTLATTIDEMEVQNSINTSLPTQNYTGQQDGCLLKSIP